MDSSDEVQNLTNSQAAGFSKETSFCDDFLKKLRFVGCAWRGVGEGIYLSGEPSPRRRLPQKRAKQAKRSFFRKAQRPKRNLLQAGIKWLL
ncbi:hypothetical protein [Helicobacter zhangjianzhongii]|uniref:Uncharacterized protein n=1 Tax=Helicobacter zhangjianzhongii TaxID=2974574 RepID=A0ACC6FRH2_9HELI|nr:MULTISPECIES: hypothetical protein [unclassified Helicobacter]MDL0080086.1 hypothetical protein [Helicobacter sp. CPD2-1]MDL0081874.1 hypothetical protein [Helicobacter sp. XJK30-2]